MTNQMKMVLKVNFVFSFLAVLGLLVQLFYGNFGYLYAFSYVALAVAVCLFIINLLFLLYAIENEKKLKKQIAYYKLLKVLRHKAILEFYDKYKLSPQYKKNGELLTPDEFLGIITKLDEKGNLEPSVYEMLGLKPQFDENGNQVPIILVLKHLIKDINKGGAINNPKLKGLYAKGTKKEMADNKAEKPATKEAESAAKAKDKKKAEKKGKGSVVPFKPPKSKDKGKDKGKGDAPKDKAKDGGNSGKDATKPQPTANTEVKKPETPQVEKITKSDSDFWNSLQSNHTGSAIRSPQSSSPPKVTKKIPQKDGYIGEAFPDI